MPRCLRGVGESITRYKTIETWFRRNARSLVDLDGVDSASVSNGDKGQGDGLQDRGRNREPMRPCPACEGDGWVEAEAPPGRPPETSEQPFLRKCRVCAGTGRVSVVAEWAEAELPPDPPAEAPEGAGDDFPF